jgi:hypothetical protein
MSTLIEPALNCAFLFPSSLIHRSCDYICFFFALPLIILSFLSFPWMIGVPRYRSRGAAFDSLRYQIFVEVLVLERGPLSLVSTIEELLGRKSSYSGLENLDYCRRDPLC